MLADATPIRIAPLSEVFDEETIKLIKTQIRPEPKLCFKNATLLWENMMKARFCRICLKARFTEVYMNKNF